MRQQRRCKDSLTIYLIRVGYPMASIDTRKSVLDDCDSSLPQFLEAAMQTSFGSCSWRKPGQLDQKWQEERRNAASFFVWRLIHQGPFCICYLRRASKGPPHMASYNVLYLSGMSAPKAAGKAARLLWKNRSWDAATGRQTRAGGLMHCTHSWVHKHCKDPEGTIKQFHYRVVYSPNSSIFMK